MNSRMVSHLAQLSLALCLCVSVRAADNWVRYEGQPGSKLRIDGTSTMHEWSVESQIIGGFMEFQAAFPEESAAAPAVKGKVEVSIPVRSLKSGKKNMDNVMYDTMKQAQHPKIEYRLLELLPRKGGAAPQAQFDAKGALTVAGVTRTNTMPVSLERLEKTKLKVTGTANLKMTEFGMKPPAPEIALGLIKTGDEVKVTFEWLAAQAADKAQ